MSEADDADSDLEYVLLNKKDAKVYQVPPATSAAGHQAGEWKEAIWRGNLRISARGKELTIRLLDRDTNKLFAQCVIPDGEHEKFVERVVDSSRYWVMKIVNGQRHAFIGFGFSERNDAFDFNACLADFKATWVDKPAEAESVLSQPMKDLSLKQGETLRVNLPGRGGRRREREAGYEKPALGVLAPPAAASTAIQVPAAEHSTAPASAAWTDDDDFADFQSAAAEQTKFP
mmetsp:Transcript_24785/g.56023  ORF Transcript_24785/g.56023 Transcript_24785/m.56023 type:complete len:231 (+) Transcript_24785:44-736(+)